MYPFCWSSSSSLFHSIYSNIKQHQQQQQQQENIRAQAFSTSRQMFSLLQHRISSFIIAVAGPEPKTKYTNTQTERGTELEREREKKKRFPKHLASSEYSTIISFWAKKHRTNIYMADTHRHTHTPRERERERNTQNMLYSTHTQHAHSIMYSAAALLACRCLCYCCCCCCRAIEAAGYKNRLTNKPNIKKMVVSCVY